MNQLPEGWAIKPMGDASLAIINPAEKLPKSGTYSFVPMDAIADGFGGIRHFETVTEASGGYTRFRDGDILLAKITPCIENGKVARVTGLNGALGLGSTEFHVIRPADSTNGDYLFYLLSSGLVHSLAVSLMEGTTGRQRIPASIFKKRLAAPVAQDKNEQDRIATALKQVDAAIAATQASIAAAQKLKQALMQNLLTGKLKPDGTWRREDEFEQDTKFGRVPKGWTIKTINDVFTVNEHTLGASTAPDFRFRYIELELVDTQVVNYEAANCYFFSDSPGRARRQLKGGDFLFSTVRPNLLGFAKFNIPDSTGDWVGSTGFSVARPREHQDGDFYFYQILSKIGQRQFHALVTGSNYPAINDSQFRKLQVLSPPYAVQQEIASNLVELDKFIAESRRPKLVRLQLLKKTLMQNLLTGKIRIPAK